MQLINCVQGSREWHEARAGVITASMFGEICKTVNGLNDQQQKYVTAIMQGKSEKTALDEAGYKAAPKAEVVSRALNGEQVGEFSNAAKQYGFKLAIERISGTLLEEDKFETFEMRRGRELEPEARFRHEQEIGEMVEQIGFIKTDDGLFGASLDGLIGTDGASEYKCFMSPSSLMPIVLENDISDCVHQVQGVLWLSGRKWTDFCLHCPALAAANKDFIRFRTLRDEEFIAEMETKLLKFNALVCEYETKLRSK